MGMDEAEKKHIKSCLTDLTCSLFQSLCYTLLLSSAGNFQNGLTELSKYRELPIAWLGALHDDEKYSKTQH